MNVNQINEVSAARYGFGVCGLDPMAALWLAEHILERFGVNVYKTISRLRHKNGKGTTFPEYGSDVFKSM